MSRHLYSIFVLICISFGGNAQVGADMNAWTKQEKLMHKTLTELCAYVDENRGKLSKDTLFARFIYFDYVLKDTVVARREERVQKFDTLFYFFHHRIDSLGLQNLDAKPIRFYKDHEIYKLFNKDLSREAESVFAYFLKSDPSKPLGTLLLDRKSGKLVAWILIDQGGAHYYLTFNMF